MGRFFSFNGFYFQLRCKRLPLPRINVVVIRNPLKILHYLSLDVVAGAVLSSWAFWRLPEGSARPDYLTLFVLGSTTWVLYILDRLLDLRIYPPDHTARHKFHHRHQYNLQIMLLALVVINGVLIFVLPQSVLLYGAGLTVGVSFYFWVLNKFFRNNKAQWVKEPTTAIFYTLAVVGTALVAKPSINLSGWILIGIFFLIALQNLLIFSLFEFTHSADSQNFVQIMGVKASKRIIHLITFLIIVILFTFFLNGREYVNYFAGVELLMTLSLSFLIAIPHWAAVNDRYRWLGDGVFLLPALLFLI